MPSIFSKFCKTLSIKFWDQAHLAEMLKVHPQFDVKNGSIYTLIHTEFLREAFSI
jgi:hypothetical protein